MRENLIPDTSIKLHKPLGWDNIPIGKNCTVSFSILDENIIQIIFSGSKAKIDSNKYDKIHQQVLGYLPNLPQATEILDFSAFKGQCKNIAHLYFQKDFLPHIKLRVYIVSASFIVRNTFRLGQNLYNNGNTYLFANKIADVYQRIESAKKLGEKIFSGKPYIKKDNWSYRNNKSGFEIDFFVIDSHILYSKHSGSISDIDISYISNILSEIFKSDLLSKEYIKIANYADTEYANWKPRRLYAQTLNQLHTKYKIWPKATFITGASPAIKATLSFAQKFVNQNFIFCKTTDEAIWRIYHDNTYKGTGKKQIDEEIIIHQSDIETIIQNIGSIVWGEKQSDLQEREKLPRDLKEIDQALELIQIDFKALMQERDNSLEQAKQAEQKAIKTNEQKLDFIANISHEIRTPLNAIIGLGRLLREKIKEPVFKDNIDTILHSGEALLLLFNDLLDISMLEKGTLELESHHVNIYDFGQQIYRIFKHQAENRNLEFEYHAEVNKELTVVSDPVRLRQILFNLVGNAIKFTNEGKIVLHIKEHNNENDTVDLQFSVQDTGIGIPKEELDSIFDSFRQYSRNKQSYIAGTGMGLAIVKKLTEKLKGNISVESELGKGSKFTISLKHQPTIKHCAVPKISPPDSEEEYYALPHLKIVSYCNKPINQELIKNDLDIFQCNVYFTGNIKQTITLSEFFFPDIIIIWDSDIKDSECKELRNIQQDQKCIIIFIGSNANHKDLFNHKTIFIHHESELVKLKSFIKSNYVPQSDKKESETITDKATEEWFKQQFDAKLLPQTKTLLSNFAVNDIEEFAKELETIAHEKHLYAVENFYNRLSSALANFDIEKIEQLLVDFEKIPDSIHSEP